jgi:hypothetical protein
MSAFGQTCDDFPLQAHRLVGFTRDIDFLYRFSRQILKTGSAVAREAHTSSSGRSSTTEQNISSVLWEIENLQTTQTACLDIPATWIIQEECDRANALQRPNNVQLHRIDVIKDQDLIKTQIDTWRVEFSIG